MQTLENIIRMAIDFEGRTAFPVSDYDQRPLDLLMSAAKLARAKRRQESDIHFSQEIYELLEEMEHMLEEAPNRDSFDLVKDFINIAREVAYGGRKESNLDQYGYDMVFAATLGSVNMVMKEYLDKTASNITPQTKYFIEKQEGTKVVYEEASEEEARRLDELDLFSISDNPDDWTPEQKSALDEAYWERMLAFGFRAAIGFPEAADVGSILDFDTGETGNHTKVKYNMYFKKLSIIQFATSRRGGYNFTNLSQSTDPWVFNYTVDLGMAGVSVEGLPKDIRDKVNNIDPGQIFSINQLFMDLNTTALMSSPSIVGLDPNTSHYLDTYFLGFLLKKIKETSGDVILGYSITPKSVPSDKPYLLNPKDFRFYVSPYWENGQAVPEKKKLYTLNYIVICEDKPFPELRQITWNWVNEDEYVSKNGVMVISNSQIYKFAKNEYKKLIENLLFNVIAEISIDDPIYIYWKLGVERDWSVNPEFNDADKTFTYYRYAEDSDYFVPLWGNVQMTYNLKAVLRHYQSEDGRSILECRVDTVCWLHANAEGGVSEGNIYNKTTWYTLTINVDQYGKLTLEPNFTETDNGTTFNISGWSAFVACGLEDYLDSVKDSIDGYITENKDYWNQSFLNRYNSNAFWYLPGDGSLVCSQPDFSNTQDLTFDANYATPTNG